MEKDWTVTGPVIFSQCERDFLKNLEVSIRTSIAPTVSLIKSHQPDLPISDQQIKLDYSR